jgi:GMP synthase (glutamine-hydrolysing)
MPDDQDAASTDSTHRVSTTGDVEVSTYLEIASGEVRAKVGASGRTPADAGAPPKRDTIAILDFGSQYSRLIARRVREQNVYCEILPADAKRDAIKDVDLAGIILSGGPASVYEEGAPQAPAWVFDAGVPVLGICYGMQLIAHQRGVRHPISPRGGTHAAGHSDPAEFRL